MLRAIREVKSPFLIGLLLFLCLGNGVAQAGGIVTIQPILVHNTDGSDGQKLVADGGMVQFYEDATNKIWAQAGITVVFLAANNFNNTDYLRIHGETTPQAGFKSLADLQAAPGNGANPDPKVINMWFVNDTKNAFGLAFRGGNSIAIDPRTFTDNRIDTIAHEIGHSLGLPHHLVADKQFLMTNGLDRMTPGGLGDITPDGAKLDQLDAGEIAKAMASPFLTPEPSTIVLALVGAGGFGFFALRRRIRARNALAEAA
jgi:hypothetical protein